jgi:hypothetical protein
MLNYLPSLLSHQMEGGLLSDEVLNMLEAAELNVGNSESYLSLHALAGTQSNRAIHFRALINNQVLSILVDSRSTHTFLNDSMVYKLQLLPQSVKPMTVKVANGESIQTT